jgi:hypothetical protein
MYLGTVGTHELRVLMVRLDRMQTKVRWLSPLYYLSRFVSYY